MDLSIRIQGQDNSADAFKSASGSTKDLTKELERTAEAAEKTAKNTEKLARDLVKGFKEAAKFIGEAVAKYQELADENDETAKKISGLTAAVEDTQAAFGGFIVKMGEATGAFDFLNASMEAARDTLMGLPKFFDNLIKKWDQVKIALPAFFRKQLGGELSLNDVAKLSEAEDALFGGVQKEVEKQTSAFSKQRAARDKGKEPRAPKAAKEEEPEFEFDAMDIEVVHWSSDDLEKELEKRRELMAKASKESLADLAKATKESERLFDQMQMEMKKKEHEYLETGLAIGSALVAGINAGMAAESETDAAFAVVDTVIAGIGVVADAIWPGAGRVIAGVGHGISGAVKGAVKKGQADVRTPKRARGHEGMWAGERYHDGGWVGMNEHPAILQTGERVLSRGEVRAMGGASGVDRMAGAGRGGGTVTINVSAMDAKGTSEFFQRDGGRGVFHALRSGRGDLGRALGGGR